MRHLITVALLMAALIAYSIGSVALDKAAVVLGIAAMAAGLGLEFEFWKRLLRSRKPEVLTSTARQ